MSNAPQKAAALTEQDNEVTDELEEILGGLRIAPRSISPKYFYDERGSRLFDRICRLPEYYLTRTELAIMKAFSGEISALIGPRASLIEFGSGSSLKIRILLQHLPDLAAYVPVDISKEHLLRAAEEIAHEFPAIEVLPVAADFTHPFELPEPRITPVKNVVYFPGSTIGNFSPEAAHELLHVMRLEAAEGGGLLIGIDLQKDPAILERAYNDWSGVTAEFNLNILRRINREFGADFDLSGFAHEATYNEEAGRIEIYLVSLDDQLFHIGDEEMFIAEGERILTEHSHKYTVDGFSQMLERAGFRLEKTWTDRNEMFAVCYCTAV